MDLFDPETGKPINVPDEGAEDAVLNGIAALKPERPYFLKAADGKVYETLGSEADTLLKNGYRFESPEETSVRRYKADAKNTRTWEEWSDQNLDAIGRNFVDTASLGILDAYAEYNAAKNPKDVIAQKREIDYEDAFVGRWLGAGLATIMTPTGLAGSIESAAGKVLAKTGVVQEGVIAAGNVASNLAISALQKIGIDTAKTVVKEGVEAVAPTVAAKTASFLAGAATRGGVSVIPSAIGTELATDYSFPTGEELEKQYIKDPAAAGELMASSSRSMADLADETYIRGKRVLGKVAEGAVTGPILEGGLNMSAAMISNSIKALGKSNAAQWMRDKADSYSFGQLNFKTTEFRKMREQTQAWWGKEATDTEITADLAARAREAGVTDFMSPAAAEKLMQKYVADAGAKMNVLRAEGNKAFPNGVPVDDLISSLKAKKLEYAQESTSSEMKRSAKQVQTIIDDIEQLYLGKAPVTKADKAKILKGQSDRKLSGEIKTETVTSPLVDEFGAPITSTKVTEFSENKLNFDDFQSLRGTAGKLMKLKRETNGSKEGFQDAYTIIGSFIDKKLEQATSLPGNEGLHAAWKSAKEQYGKGRVLVPLLSDAADRLEGNNFWSIYDGMTLGGTLAASVEPATAALTIALQKVGRAYGKGASASILRGVANGARDWGKNSDSAFSGIVNGANTVIKQRSGIIGTAISNELLPGNSDSIYDKQAKYSRMVAAVNGLASQPELTDDLVQRYSNHLSEMPNVQAQAAATAKRGVEYLRALMPRPKAPSTPLDPSSALPSDQALSEFGRRFQAVTNPDSVLREIENGTVAREHIEALKIVYPKMYESLNDYYLQKVADTGYRIPYKARSRLKFIIDTGSATPASGINLSILQNNFQAGENAQPKPLANSKITEASRSGTDVTRIMNQ